MKKIKALKLGTKCTDKATKLNGTLTHWIMYMSGNINYFFQPKGLNDEGRPMDKLFLEIDRLTDYQESDFEEVEVPFEILGTQVTDDASGFTGMATSFVRHMNGCFHVYIQPEGVNEKTKNSFERFDFDLRQCSGKMIKKLSEQELAQSKKDKPSPSSGNFDTTPKLRDQYK